MQSFESIFLLSGLNSLPPSKGFFLKITQILLDFDHIVKGDQVYTNPASQHKQKRRVPAIVDLQEGKNVYSPHHARHQKPAAENSPNYEGNQLVYSNLFACRLIPLRFRLDYAS